MTITDSSDAAAAVDDLYRAHGLALIRFALMLTGDRASAEDVVQDAFIGLYRGWHRIEDPASALAYLRSSVVNGARSAHRARSRLRTRLLRSVRHDPPVWSAESAAMERADQRAVLAAVASLPRRQREVLALKYFMELSEQEIAQILGIARGTVASTAARAIQVLGRQFGQETR